MVAVVVVVFALPRAMPGDPLAALDDPDNSLYVTDPVVRDKVRAYYGLDEPLPEQFGQYVGRLARGDLGFSIARKRRCRACSAPTCPGRCSSWASRWWWRRW